MKSKFKKENSPQMERGYEPKVVTPQQNLYSSKFSPENYYQNSNNNSGSTYFSNNNNSRNDFMCNNNYNNSNNNFYNQGPPQMYNNKYYNNEENNQNFSPENKYLVNGKYTCKFEIQIENDNEFQVARRLIGSKGCNMKKIVDICSRNFDGNFSQDGVKLRLRGRGSGYKEGPFNKESDDTLHLCISSKFLETYKKACSLVQELLANVYEEYKVFCNRAGRIPVLSFAVQKEEGVSSRKNNNNFNSNTNNNNNFNSNNNNNFNSNANNYYNNYSYHQNSYKQSFTPFIKDIIVDN